MTLNPVIEVIAGSWHEEVEDSNQLADGREDNSVRKGGEAMRKYNPNPKHETPGTQGRKGSKLDLSPLEAERLLNDPLHCFEVPGKRQLVGVLNDKIYVFQEDGTGGYHAYPATGNEVYTKFPTIAARIASLLGMDIKRFSRLQN